MVDPKIQAQIDALNAAFMQARGGGEDFRTRMPDLSPELLAFFKSQQAERDSAGNGLLRSFIDPSGANFHQYGNYATTGQGDSQSMSYDPNLVNWSQSPIQFGVNSDTSNYLANYDQQGRFTGYEMAADNNNWRDFITAMLMMAPAIAGVYGAAAGTTGEAGAVSGMDLAADAAYGSGNNIFTAGEALNGGTAAAGMSGGQGGGGGAGGASGEAGTTGVSDFRAGEIANYGTNGSQPLSAAQVGGNMNALDWAKVGLNGTTGTEGLIGSGGNMNYGGNTASTSGLNNGGLLGAGAQALTGGNGNTVGALLGGLASYLDSKDGKTNSTQVEPWKPAQPYLEGLLREGAKLYDQYKQQPFSQSEQTAYGNYGNVLDYINGNAGGLLSGFQANASGANQFSRDNPRRQLIGAGYDPNNPVVPWLPQRYGNFGTGGK